MASNLRPTTKGLACEICGNETGKCRVSDDDQLHQCMNESQAPTGFVAIGPTKNRQWNQFVRQSQSAEPRQKRNARPSKPMQTLSPGERDRQYRKIFSSLSLSDVDRSDLERRGFTADQIRWFGAVSVEQWQETGSGFEELPGVLPGGSLNTQPGLLIPVRDVDGRIVGCQMRLRGPGDGGRYRWLSSSTKKNPDGATPHVNGELPPAVWRPVEVLNPAIGLCEGAGHKPFLAANRLGQNFVGAAGGNFGSSPNTLKQTLGSLSKETGSKSVVFYPDAGCTNNPQVLKTMRQTFDLIQKLGYQLQVAWWGQFEKGTDPDIDELQDFSKINLLTLPEFLAIAGEDAAEFYSRGEHAALEEVKNWNQIVFDTLYSNPEKPWICCLGRLYEWTSTHYAESPDEVELQRIRDLAEKTPRIGRKAITFPYAKPSAIREALDWAKLCLAVQPEQCNPAGVNCTNGVAVWNGSDFDLKPHSPDVYFLYQPGIEFKPDADQQHCDRLLEALEPEHRDIFLRLAASAIDLPTVRKKHGRSIRAALLRGDGNNGKDSLRAVLSQIFGDVGMVDVPFEDFDQYDSGRKFPLSVLSRAKVNWASENGKGVRLDGCQSLKRTITGEVIQIEMKGKDAKEFKPNVVHFFNINDIPRLSGALEAIASRFAVIPFDKTFVKNADPSKGQLEADPRFKYDLEWVRENVAPALLNRLLQAFKDLMAEGIDYSPCAAALQEVQIHNSHLFEFALENELTYDPDSVIQIGDLWSALENYYENTGILVVSSDGKRVWEDPIRPGDQYVKSARQIPQRFLALYPKCSKVSMGQRRYGIKGLRFGPKPQEVQPDPEPQTEPQQTAATAEHVFNVGDPVELADGRQGIVEAVQPDSVSGGFIFAVKNGKPTPEWFGSNEIRYPVGTQVLHKRRNRTGSIVKVENGLYQVEGDTFFEWLKPTEFEIRRVEA